MPYIGTQPLTGQFKKLDAISVVNGQRQYTLNYNSAAYKPATANALLVSVNGVVQAAGDAYTINGSTIEFTENLVTGDVIDFIIALGDTGSAVTPVDGSVTTAKLASPVGIDTTSSTFKMTDLTTNAFYRTGTFTPFYGSSGASTAYTVDVFTSASYLAQSGSYVRIGDLVTANVRLKLDYSAATYQNGGASSHTLSVGGFPFKWKNDSNYFPTTGNIYFNFDNSQGWSSYNLIGMSNVHNVNYLRLLFSQGGGSIGGLTLENVFDQSGDQAQSLDSQVILQMTYETDEA